MNGTQQQVYCHLWGMNVFALRRYVVHAMNFSAAGMYPLAVVSFLFAKYTRNSTSRVHGISGILLLNSFLFIRPWRKLGLVSRHEMRTFWLHQVSLWAWHSPHREGSFVWFDYNWPAWEAAQNELYFRSFKGSSGCTHARTHADIYNGKSARTLTMNSGGSGGGRGGWVESAHFGSTEFSNHSLKTTTTWVTSGKAFCWVQLCRTWVAHFVAFIGYKWDSEPDVSVQY